MNKKHRYEKDLEVFTKIKKDSEQMLKQFFDDYKEFEKVSQMKGNAFEKPLEMINYCNNKSEKIEEMFSIIAAAMPFRFNNFNATILDFCNKTGADFKKFSIVENEKDITKLYNRIVIISHNAALNRSVVRIEIYVYIISATIKYYIDYYNGKMKAEKDFLDRAYKPFKEYCDCIDAKENISSNLINQIIKLISEEYFELSNKDVSKHDYIEELKKYTEEHNKNVEAGKLKVALAPKTKQVKTSPKYESTPVLTEDLISDKQYLKDIEELKKEDDIDNWVSSFLPILCSETTISNIDEILPHPRDTKNYDMIIIKLLQCYESYLEEKECCSMNETHLYIQLQNIVESLKK